MEIEWKGEDLWCERTSNGDARSFFSVVVSLAFRLYLTHGKTGEWGKKVLFCRTRTNAAEEWHE